MSRINVVLLWALSILLTGVLASAQARRDTAGIVSGSDIGFRPEGWNGKARTGTWMVRINGDWVEAQSALKRVPATTR